MVGDVRVCVNVRLFLRHPGTAADNKSSYASQCDLCRPEDYTWRGAFATGPLLSPRSLEGRSGNSISDQQREGGLCRVVWALKTCSVLFSSRLEVQGQEILK